MSKTYIVTIASGDASDVGSLNWAADNAVSGDIIVFAEELVGQTVSMEKSIAAGVLLRTFGQNLSGYFYHVYGEVCINGGIFSLGYHTFVNDGGSLTIKDASVTRSSSNYGIHICRGGFLVVENSSVSFDVCGSLGIDNGSVISIKDSFFAGSLSCDTSGSITGSTFSDLSLGLGRTTLNNVTAESIILHGGADFSNITNTTLSGGITLDHAAGDDLRELFKEGSGNSLNGEVIYRGAVTGENIIFTVAGASGYRVKDMTVSQGARFDTNGHNLSGNFYRIYGDVCFDGGIFSVDYHSYVNDGGSLTIKDASVTRSTSNDGIHICQGGFLVVENSSVSFNHNHHCFYRYEE